MKRASLIVLLLTVACKQPQTEQAAKVEQEIYAHELCNEAGLKVDTDPYKLCLVQANISFMEQKRAEQEKKDRALGMLGLMMMQQPQQATHCTTHYSGNYANTNCY